MCALQNTQIPKPLVFIFPSMRWKIDIGETQTMIQIAMITSVYRLHFQVKLLVAPTYSTDRSEALTYLDQRLKERAGHRHNTYYNVTQTWIVWVWTLYQVRTHTLPLSLSLSLAWVCQYLQVLVSPYCDWATQASSWLQHNSNNRRQDRNKRCLPPAHIPQVTGPGFSITFSFILLVKTDQLGHNNPC